MKIRCHGPLEALPRYEWQFIFGCQTVLAHAPDTEGPKCWMELNPERSRSVFVTKVNAAAT